MRLSAAGCLRRGWTNLSANWELVLLQWLQSFAGSSAAHRAAVADAIVGAPAAV